MQDQLVRYPSDVMPLFLLNISKNNQHRFKDTDSKNKRVRVYAQPGSDGCLVKILATYLASLPKNFSCFYARPLGKFNSDPMKPGY